MEEKRLRYGGVYDVILGASAPRKAVYLGASRVPNVKYLHILGYLSERRNPRMVRFSNFEQEGEVLRVSFFVEPALSSSDRTALEQILNKKGMGAI